tara:strand:- start:145 stop:447 length:303 start_codon:yes stop_codon:yes gene_type:complete
MKQTMDMHGFINEFKNVRADNFSYEGLSALYGYLTELEEDGGQEFEFDPIAWCCEYTEYESLEDFQKQHDKFDFESIDDIKEVTSVIEIDGSDRLIVQNF